MQLNLEKADKHSIQAYSDTEIKINQDIYQQSLIVSTQEIISGWPIKHLHQLNEETLIPLLRHEPKIIIIGQPIPGQLPPFKIFEQLSKQQIGLECMSIGAACRTYNVLLSELREVTLGIILA